jgi:peroxiredoxin
VNLRVRVLVGALLATGLVLAVACGGEDSSDVATVEGTAAAASPSSEKPARKERPLPAFSGFTLDDERFDISTRIGKRLVVYFFDPTAKEAVAVTRAVARVAESQAEHNFEVIGVAVGASRPNAKKFATDNGVTFPVVDDASRRISGRLGLRSPMALLGVDAEGYMVWGMLQFPTHAPDAVSVIEKEIRTALRLQSDQEAGPVDLPLAPTFTASTLDGDEPFDFASTRGKPRILIFFLHTCPHCHEALEFLKGALDDLPEDKRPVLYGLELTGRRSDVRRSLRESGLDFFPVIFDDSRSAINAYGVFGGVPDMMLIDRNDRIAHRISGWRAEIDGPLLRMRLAKLAGAPVPMLLRAQGFSGSETCGVCHASQYETWQLTTHARAYDTLVKHGSDTDPECVGCHVIGFGEAGGFELVSRSPELEDVGCESCHGRGGQHLSPGFTPNGDYQAACVGCHDQKHSLGFDYGTFLPKISHAANAHVLALPAAERQRILAERGAIRKNLLPTTADHVGSDACRSCHAKEFETWAQGPHAGALASLDAKKKADDVDCLKCHTTGFGRVGGFPPDGVAADHADLARVGCESCHGPGGDHVADSATKLGDIVSLGDKCDSCVILQICGSCHDDANDPGFEFEVQEKIDEIRHGTIEAGTGKPLEPGASAARTSESALLARAFSEQQRREEESWTQR